MSLLLGTPLFVFGQLTVDSIGKVSIGGEANTLASLTTENLSDNSEWYYDIHGHYGVLSEQKSTKMWTFGLAGYAHINSDRHIGVGAFASPATAYSYGRNYGVYARAGNATSGYNYAVYGALTGTNNGTGILGCIGDYHSAVPGRFAGFFYGQTRVNGDFYATSLNTTSDARLKTNIADIRRDVLTDIEQLHPVQYQWRQIELPDGRDTAKVPARYFSDDTDLNRLHYGFVAQEVQKLLPDLVHEDEAGYLSVNYVEVVPLLVKALQELSAEVSELRGSIVKRAVAQQSSSTLAALYQNNPNPFTENTRIEFVVPEKAVEAFLYIYNMSGTQLEKIILTSRGEGSIQIDGNQLGAGMYLYALIIDGQLIDTKQMILTK